MPNLTIDVAKVLEDDALLTFDKPAISKDRLNLPGPDFVDRVVAMTDRNQNTLNNFHRILNHGRLAGTGPWCRCRCRGGRPPRTGRARTWRPCVPSEGARGRSSSAREWAGRGVFARRRAAGGHREGRKIVLQRVPVRLGWRPVRPSVGRGSGGCAAGYRAMVVRAPTRGAPTGGVPHACDQHHGVPSRSAPY